VEQPRYELRQGKFGPYFHDTERGGRDGYDMPLADVLDKLNRLKRMQAALEPFARKADAVSLSEALGHIEREHLREASRALEGK
jgi:hypothetical protein